jgi:hypothetical protein
MGITLEKDKHLLKVTTQKEVVTAVHPIYQHYRTGHIDLNRSRIKGNGTLTGCLRAKIQSLEEQVHGCTPTGISQKCFQQKQSQMSLDAAYTLKDFFQDVRLPEHITSDQASELCDTNSELLVLAKRKCIDHTVKTEPN